MEGRGIEIRLAVMEDVESLARLARQVFGETYGAAVPEERLGPYLAHTFATEAFVAMLREATATLFVATIDGTIGGYGKLVAAPPPGDGTLISTVELSSLYVERRCQGLGLGKALMSHALTWAAQQAYNTMWLCVWQENRRAHRFYQRLGFAICGEIEISVDGVIFHDWVMHRSTSETHTALPSPIPMSAEYSSSTTPPPLRPAPPGTVHSAS